MLMTLMSGGGGVWRLPPSAPAPTKVAESFSEAIAVAGSSAYAGSTSGIVTRVDLASGIAEEVAFVDDAIVDVLADDSFVYLAVQHGERGSIQRVDPKTREVMTLAPNEDRPSALAFSGDVLYWANEGVRVNGMLGHSGSVRCVGPGRPIATVASDLAAPSSLAVDADGIYVFSFLDEAMVRLALP